MRFPRPLPADGTVGIVAPAFGATTEPYATALANAEKVWRSRGLEVREWPCVRRDDGVGISSTPVACGTELTEAWCGDEADVLLSCGGGELMCEAIAHVDFDAVAGAEPKWFMGYSDNTNMTFLLATIADVASVYGPCAPAFGMEPWHPSLGDAWDVICGRDPAGRDPEFPTVGGYDAWQIEAVKDEEHPLAPYNVTEPACASAWLPDGERGWREDEATSMHGRLLGGCLDVLQGLCGTRLDRVADFNRRYAGDGVVWFVESCDLGPLTVRRAMWQLAQAGWFDNATGFVVGRPMRFGDEEMGLSFADAMLGALSEAGIRVPVLLDCDLGHLPPAMPLVCGSLADVSFAGGRPCVRMGLVS